MRVLLRTNCTPCENCYVYSPFMSNSVAFCLLQCLLLALHQTLLEGRKPALILLALFILSYAFKQLMKKDLRSGLLCPFLSHINSQMSTVWQSKKLDFTIRQNWVSLSMSSWSRHFCLSLSFLFCNMKTTLGNL